MILLDINVALFDSNMHVILEYLYTGPYCNFSQFLKKKSVLLKKRFYYLLMREAEGERRLPVSREFDWVLVPGPWYH